MDRSGPIWTAVAPKSYGPTLQIDPVLDRLTKNRSEMKKNEV